MILETCRPQCSSLGVKECKLCTGARIAGDSHSYWKHLYTQKQVKGLLFTAVLSQIADINDPTGKSRMIFVSLRKITISIIQSRQDGRKCIKLSLFQQSHDAKFSGPYKSNNAAPSVIHDAASSHKIAANLEDDWKLLHWKLLHWKLLRWKLLHWKLLPWKLLDWKSHQGSRFIMKAIKNNIQ